MMYLKKQSFPSIALSFLLVGLPIIFALREYIPISKMLFTYTIIGLMLLRLINYKNLIKFQLYSDKPFIISFLLISILLLFTIYYLLATNPAKHFSEAIYILLTILILFALFSRKLQDFATFPKYIMLISSISTVVTLLTTPLNSGYWLLHGGRLFVGDTANPNLSASVALMNILSIIFYFYFAKHVIKHTVKILLIVIALASLYIYFLSFSKSAILGFFFALLIFIPANFYKSIRFFKGMTLIFVLFFLFLILVPDLSTKIGDKIVVLSNAFNSYFYGEYTNLAADSAAIRHVNLNHMFALLPNLELFNGNGIFTTRADLPPLQVFTDLGILLGILNLFVMILIPLYILFRQRNVLKTYNTDPLYPLYFMSVVIFLFYLPNLFFHGTPYEFTIWLPILILYKFAPWKKKVNCD